MHMEAEVNGAGVNFNQADALLHHIITEALAMAGAQHAHEAVEAGKPQQHIFTASAIPGEIAFLWQVG